VLLLSFISKKRKIPPQRAQRKDEVKEEIATERSARKDLEPSRKNKRRAQKQLLISITPHPPHSFLFMKDGTDTKGRTAPSSGKAFALFPIFFAPLRLEPTIITLPL
jgi:hypothetical protein